MQLGAKETENERFSHYFTKTYRKTASLIANSLKAVSIAHLKICNKYSKKKNRYRLQQFLEPTRRSSKPPSNTARTSGSPSSSWTICWTSCRRRRPWASQPPPILSSAWPPRQCSSPAKRSVRRFVGFDFESSHNLCSSS